MIIRRLKFYARFLKSLMGINFRLLYGVWKISKLPQPIITIFGGARISHESKYAQQARLLAKMLAADGYSIITGGGPGIMEAANEGALEHLKECRLNGGVCQPIVSAGISLVRLNKEKANPFVQENVKMEYFFERKWLLVRQSTGFIVFPGGFGTLDELFEILTLVQTERMKQKAPIILMDSHYWQPIINWIETRAIKEGLLSEHDAKLIQVLDTVETAFEVIDQQCWNQKENNQK
ncbi:MAG: TIGR00730 family Rossman fold protein [bacterium]